MKKAPSTIFTTKRSLRLGLVIAVLIGLTIAIGSVTYHYTGSAVLGIIEGQLRGQRNSTADALASWLREKQLEVEVLAHSSFVQSGTLDLSKTAKNREDLRASLQELVFGLGYDGFAISDQNGRVVLGPSGGDDNTLLAGEILNALGEIENRPSLMTPPLPQFLHNSVPHPYLFAIGAIQEINDLSYFLILSIDPRRTFSSILENSKSGISGETYAFDRQGRLLNQSRFHQDLINSGITKKNTSLLNIELRDSSLSPEAERSSMPLTAIAQRAINAKEGSDGIELDRFIDYRGVPCVGAWIWLEEFQFGLCSKMDIDEAYAPMRVVELTGFSVLALMGLGSIVAAVFFSANTALQRRLDRVQHDIDELGQYQLVRKLGEGGMGAVYLANHRLMARQTAIKLISRQADENAVARFEREVQMTSQLTHPNTIQIYDYGRNEDGTFYYAMELLPGADLEVIIAQYGPMPPARVAHILIQACGSLAEAHAHNLIHRDIKPANIYLCERGGMQDFVKVLDFGLVKNTQSKGQSVALSQADVISGTPPYMCPEIINQSSEVDGRSDLYSLACVGYFLLTGRCVFEHDNVMQILMDHIKAAPVPPSTLTNQTIPEDLEAVLMRCLAKDPNDRPDNAEALQAELEKCACASQWTQTDARAWWQQHRLQEMQSEQPSTDRKLLPTIQMATSTQLIDVDINDGKN